jgi:hypothetical protein
MNDDIDEVNGTIAFHADGTCEKIETGIYTDFIDNLKYKIEARGEYKIENSYLIFDYDLENIEIKVLQSEDRGLTKEFNKEIPRRKHEIVGNNKFEIDELNEKHLKIEDDVFEVFTFIRKKEASKKEGGKTNKSQKGASKNADSHDSFGEGDYSEDNL